MWGRLPRYLNYNPTRMTGHTSGVLKGRHSNPPETSRRVHNNSQKLLTPVHRCGNQSAIQIA